MADDSSEKQHQASAKRIDTLRKQGQIMRSRDLSSGLIIIVAVIMVLMMSDHIARQMLDNFELSFKYIKVVMHDGEFPGHFLRKIVVENFMLLVPFILVIFITAFLSPFLFGGWNFTLEVLQFNVTKLDPFSNLKSIFSKRIFVEVARSFIKMMILFSTFIVFAFYKIHAIQALPGMTFAAEIAEITYTIKEYLGLLTASIIAIVIFDVIYHYFEFKEKVKMTTQEVKDEGKESEGNTDVKRKQRAMQMSMLRQRLSVLVPRANVVVTNPTHYAIALRYDENKDKAPRVIAKGKDYLAQQIRQLAVSNAVPIYEAPVLARAIYHTSNLGAQIHPDLYMSVALVLSYVHQLKNYQHGLGHQPQLITDFKIPDELIFQD